MPFTYVVVVAHRYHDVSTKCIELSIEMGELLTVHAIHGSQTHDIYHHREFTHHLNS
jgi:hypothetical protein